MGPRRKSSDPEGYPEKLRERVYEAGAICDTNRSCDTQSDCIRTVGECFWQSYKTETGICKDELQMLIKNKTKPEGVMDTSTQVSYGVFDPLKLLEFAKSHLHQFELSAAIVELKRRIHNHHHIAIRGVDLVKISSEADLETGMQPKHACDPLAKKE